jgi:hypothetical protein
MFRQYLSGALLAGVVATSPMSDVVANPLGASPVRQDILMQAQWAPGYGSPNPCWRLRNRAQQLRYDIYYAPPWQRAQMEQQLWYVRDRLRGECWGRD